MWFSDFPMKPRVLINESGVQSGGLNTQVFLNTRTSLKIPGCEFCSFLYMNCYAAESKLACKCAGCKNGYWVCRHRLAYPGHFQYPALLHASCDCETIGFLRRSQWFQNRSWHANVPGVKMATGCAGIGWHTRTIFNTQHFCMQAAIAKPLVSP
jgi:hypothetical protein